MKIAVTFQPVFHLPLSLADAQLLRELARNHYDWTCKRAAMAEPGGFINGWCNMLEHTTEEPGEPLTVSATWRDMDLTLKVLEMRRAMLPSRPSDLARADALNRDLHAALDRWPFIKPAETTITTEEKAHG
jgi:hypothetical protein